MLASIGTYAVLLSIITPAGGVAVDAATVRLLQKAFVLAGAAETFAFWVIHRRLMVPMLEPSIPPVPPTLEPQRALQVHMVCWALAESIAIYGLVLGLVGRAPTLSMVFFAWGAGVLLLLRPRPRFFT
jgi:hypothetical protein